MTVRTQFAIDYFRSLLRSLGRFHYLLVWSAQAVVFAVAAVGAFLLRFDFGVPRAYVGHLKYDVLICVLVKPIVFHFFELNRGWWRFVSVRDAGRLALGNATASAVSTAVILLVVPSGFPRSIYVIDFLLALLGTASIRIATRLIIELGVNPAALGGKRVVVYGAGEAGITLIRELRANRALGYSPCGFLDDNPRKRGVRIQGLRVLGTGDRLPELARTLRLEEVLIALPSANREQMNGILEHCQAAEVRFRTVPALGDLVEGRALVSQIREVAVEDLLGRSPVHLDSSSVSECLAGQVVLVTGAAGSIGSELCRQIARFRPKILVAFDMAESPLFHLERELRATHPELYLLPRIGSVQNLRRLHEVFGESSPAVVFHAAAYKHVPMMESHLFEAVENNCFGTLRVAQAAAAVAAARFVLISSDKAVRPTNVMGATKRVAELMVRSMPASGTKFAVVRFGNVLGSNGSVVPTFKKQIAAGGPVTVTDPEMQRYFMTIPEACQLVLQTSAMASGGDVFVLDMGEPVKIADLARKLILLSGHRPGVDIKIEFSGIRPGEKLFEELSTADEGMSATPHEKIRRFTGSAIAQDGFQPHWERLRLACENRDGQMALAELMALLPDFSPSDHLMLENKATAGENRRADVAHA